MKLYYAKGACSLTIHITINELGLACEFEAVDLKSKQTKSGDDYLKINPKGSVPALKIDKGEVLTEVAVIQQYLADESHAEQLLPKVGDFRRYRVLEWQNYIATEIHKSFSPLFKPDVPQEVKEKFFIPHLQTRFKFLNNHLEHNQFLSGDHFTLPDAYLFVMLTWAVSLKLDVKQWSHLLRYFNELLKRKSIEKSLQEEGLTMSVVA